MCLILGDETLSNGGLNEEGMRFVSVKGLRVSLQSAVTAGDVAFAYGFEHGYMQAAYSKRTQRDATATAADGTVESNPYGTTQGGPTSGGGGERNGKKKEEDAQRGH